MESNALESVATPVDQIIAEFVIAVESGRAPDPDEYLTRYPQFATELELFSLKTITHSSSAARRSWSKTRVTPR